MAIRGLPDRSNDEPVFTAESITVETAISPTVHPTDGNIANTLRRAARMWPDVPAIQFPTGEGPRGLSGYREIQYVTWTFRQLDEESDRLARGLVAMGISPGTRLVLMVRPSLEFLALTFALFKAGAVVVLIDPGMGARHVFRCLEQVEPQGFVAISMVQALRVLAGKRFRSARFNVTVGRKWGWGGPTYATLRGGSWSAWEGPHVASSDPAAIIFTSGSTGPAKGVLYEHGMFAAQVEQIREFYNIQPGGKDLPGFPLFALFNVAMGVTTVIPQMNPTRPARVDPRKIVAAITQEQITQAFGSPAIWNRVGRYCEQQGMQLPSVQRVLSAGAPVPVSVLERMSAALTGPEADLYTPYGATEALPVASISASEVLDETASQTAAGAGTCVGERFPGIEIRIIEMTTQPIARIEEVRELSRGDVGEIIVRGAVVTREYYRRPEATALAKIADGETFWHRMGDVGYFDGLGRLWFCGRKSHTVETTSGRMYTDCVEPIFNTHPRVARSALVGVGDRPHQQPVVIIEPEAGEYPTGSAACEQFFQELRELALRYKTTRDVRTFLLHRSLPVDVRHNVKISREKLAVWAAKRVRRTSDS